MNHVGMGERTALPLALSFQTGRNVVLMGGSRQAGGRRGPAPRLVLVWLDRKHSEQLFTWQLQASDRPCISPVV